MMSNGTAIADPLLDSISDTSCERRVSRRAAPTTAIDCEASRRATSAPIPPLAPTTIATRGDSGLMCELASPPRSGEARAPTARRARR